MSEKNHDRNRMPIIDVSSRKDLKVILPDYMLVDLKKGVRAKFNRMKRVSKQNAMTDKRVEN